MANSSDVSTITATSAYINAPTFIKITQSNSTYRHSISYQFLEQDNPVDNPVYNPVGYIKKIGGEWKFQSNEFIFSATDLAVFIPESFYAQMPDTQRIICHLTCITYPANGSSPIGTSTAQFFVNTNKRYCAPTVNGSVVDSNAVTTVLTGNANKLIRHRSTANCTIAASARYDSTLVSKKINGLTPPSSSDSLTIANVQNPVFNFTATDSRGYSSTYTVDKEAASLWIPYVELTCNPVVTRTSGDTVSIEISGNFYNGSFGSCSNKLKLQYQYLEQGSSTWSAWTVIKHSNITKTAQNTYSKTGLSVSGLDYTKSYKFKIRAYDGNIADNNDAVDGNTHPLTEITKFVTIPKYDPIFDWGQNDFNFNVPVKSKGELAYLVKYADFTVPGNAQTYPGGTNVDVLDLTTGDWANRQVLGLTMTTNTHLQVYIDQEHSKVAVYNPTSSAITKTLSFRIIYGDKIT